MTAANYEQLSDLCDSVTDVNAALEHLVQLAQDTTTAGQITYLDELLTATVIWTRRPGDIERIAAITHELITEITNTRSKVNT